MTAGTLELSGNGTILNSSTVEIRQAGRLKIVNGPGSNFERINDLAPINLYGGTLEFQAAAGTASAETLGTLTLAANQSQTVVSDFNGSTALLTFQQMAAIPAGASLNVVAKGSGLGTATNKVQFLFNPPAMAGAIVPNVTVTSSGATPRLDFATVRGSTAGFELVALDPLAYKSDLNSAGSADNVRLAAGTHTLTSSRTVNSLALEDGAVLNMSGSTLAVQGANGLAGLILGNGAVLGGGAGPDRGTLNLSLQAFITVPEGGHRGDPQHGHGGQHIALQGRPRQAGPVGRQPVRRRDERERRDLEHPALQRPGRARQQRRCQPDDGAPAGHARGREPHGPARG